MLLEAEGKVGDAVRRSLERKGIRVLLSPVKADDSGFLRLLEESGAGVVLPVFHPEILASRLDCLPPGVIAPIDSLEKIELLDNKISSVALASELGLPLPELYSSPEQIERYPVVFKRSKGLGGSGVYFPKDRTALEHLLATSGRSSALVMEYIDGWDCSVDALRWGTFFYGSAYRTILPRRKGSSILRKSIVAPELVAMTRRILEYIDFQGVCGVDFRIGRDGRAYFLECNPRFSGGVATQIQSGFDQPFLWWELATGQSLDSESIRFRAGKYSVDSPLLARRRR